LSDAIKSFIWAAPGHDIMEVDYSGIQNANGAWLAGEEWKLQAMREIIADPSKPDMYRRTAEGIYGEPIAKGDVRRQVGKVADLSLQFEGGVAALYQMARNYSVKLAPAYPSVWAAADEERREKASKRYERCLKRKEAKADVLSREGWLAGELIKIGFRATHPAISEAWTILRDAMREAVMNPGAQVKALRVDYLVSNGFLFCKLPSGRCIAYPDPRLKPMVWFKEKITGESECIPEAEAYARQRDGEGKVRDAAPAAVTALGVNSTTNRFERYGLYGGLAFQNIVMGIEVDILRHGLLRGEAAGYPAIGHIHDAGLFEVPRGFGSVAELTRIMCDLPPCYADIPLTGAGYRSKRLKKD
jgi:DNA polymerase